LPGFSPAGFRHREIHVEDKPQCETKVSHSVSLPKNPGVTNFSLSALPDFSPAGFRHRGIHVEDKPQCETKVSHSACN